MSKIEAGLTIGAVAARTGVGEPVLRAWERRYGFPRPSRLGGGHRRYDEAEVERIRRVVAERAGGRSMASAVALVLGAEPSDPSLLAGLLRARPDLPVQVLSRRAMLAFSHAIEDECVRAAERPHLVAAFQQGSRYADARDRWDDLASTAARTIVFADFPSSGRNEAGVDEVALPASSPLRREWAVVCDSPSWSACLVGVERPGGGRPYEAVWTVEPDVVRHATLVARQLAASLAPSLDAGPAPSHDPLAVAGAVLARRATSLANRVASRLAPVGSGT